MTTHADIHSKTNRGTAPLIILFCALAIGLLVRYEVAKKPIQDNLKWDHHIFVSWALLMESSGGIGTLYDKCAEGAHQWLPEENESRYFITVEKQICNYPPGAGYVLAAQGALLRQFDPKMASNSTAGRLCFASVAILADILLALGCYVLVRDLSSPMHGAIAFATVFLMPPTILDSAWWGQVDSWVLAPGIWMLWAMSRNRWLLAGVFWGIAMSLKTQGILFAPIWCFAFLLNKPKIRIIAGGLVAPVVLFITAIPFMMHSGMDWFRAAYSTNLIQIYKHTTLSAFNIWYIDLLLCDNHDAAVHLAGLEKDLWGKLLFFASFAICTGLLWKYRKRQPDVLLRFAGVTLLLAVMLPTRVHERYIFLPLPFLVCGAVMCRRLWWGVLPLIAVASFQITSAAWLEIGAARWSIIEDKVLERLNTEYEHYRETLTAEQFASLRPPEEEIQAIHKEHNRKRRATNDPVQEWMLTIFALLTTVLCLITTIPGWKPSGDAEESNLADASG